MWVLDRYFLHQAYLLYGLHLILLLPEVPVLDLLLLLELLDLQCQ
jgi:hypothetical protein